MTTDTLEPIGPRTARERLGLKTADLARRVRRTPNYINECERLWERRNAGEKVRLPSWGTCNRLANAAGYPVDLWYRFPRKSGTVECSTTPTRGKCRHAPPAPRQPKPV